MGLATTDANNLLGVRFGGVASNVPATYLVGLSSTPPQDDGTGITEPTGGYARVSLTNNGTNFATPAARAVATAVDVVFPTATTDWTNIGYWLLLDSVSVRLVAAGRFATAITVYAGSKARIVAGEISIRVSASTLQL